MTVTAYLSAEDPLSHYAWSGTHRRLYRATMACPGRTIALGPLHSPALSLIRLINRAGHKLLQRELIAHHGDLNARACGQAASARLAAQGAEVIFAPAASVELFYLNSTLPVVYLSDATPRLLEGYYPDFTAMPAATKAALERFEQKAITRAAALIYPSHWAAESAIRDYGADPAKVHVLPFGPNFDEEIPAPADRLEGERPDGQLRLLFVGRDWKRKGGDIAYQAVVGLRQAGVDAHLTLCGCTPDIAIDPAVAEVIPMIDKHKPGGYAALFALYRSADVFLLPTRAECAGVVFSEAAAFGLPIVATATGGIPTMVGDGENGLLLALSDGPAAYTEALLALVREPGRLQSMSQASLARSRAALSWKHFSHGLADILKSVSLAAGSTAP